MYLYLALAEFPRISRRNKKLQKGNLHLPIRTTKHKYSSSSLKTETVDR
jgi:hypothetical protein